MADQSIIEIADNFIQQIPDSLDLKKAFLFGSHAKNTAHEDSDIDIALVIGKMDDFFSVQRELMQLRRNIDLRIEPHPIGVQDFNKQNPFAYEIQRTGIALDVKDKTSVI